MRGMPRPARFGASAVAQPVQYACFWPANHLWLLCAWCASALSCHSFHVCHPMPAGWISSATICVTCPKHGYHSAQLQAPRDEACDVFMRCLAKRYKASCCIPAVAAFLHTYSKLPIESAHANLQIYWCSLILPNQVLILRARAWPPLIVHVDVVMTSVPIASRLACSAP